MFETDDVLPDEVLSRHLGLDTGAEEEEDPEPAAEAEEPTDQSTDTPEEGPEDEEEVETDEGEAGDDEPEDEGTDGDEEEPSEEDEPEEDDEADSFLPKFDRREIEKHPELKKAYKHMQAAFTRARMRDSEAAREAERKYEALQHEVESFQAQLRDDAGAEEFLVQVALARPEVFERAYEQAVRLAENEGERSLFTREQKLKAAERAAERERAAMERERRTQRAQEIVSLVGKLGAEAGLEGPEDFELAERFVVERINQNRLRTGVADLSNEEIEAAVQDASRLLKRQSKKVEKKVAKKLARERNEQVKAKVRHSRRPAPPRASKAPGLKPKKLPPPPPGSDPLDHTIDALFGLD